MLPNGPLELRTYFASVDPLHNTEKRYDPHWQHGVDMCDWWLRLQSKSDLCQDDIDAFLKRHRAEKDHGSGWLDLGLQFTH